MLHTNLFLILALSLLLPAEAEAKDFAIGSRVLVKGRFQRKCSARVDSNPAPGYFRLLFDRSGCGDSGQPFERAQLQALSFVEEVKVAGRVFKAGDLVVLKGFRAHACSGRVKEVSRSGYIALEFDSLFCADTDTLYKASELTKVSLVDKVSSFAVGQRVSAPGILEKETCTGTIRQLTDNGLAAISFEQLTCALEGKLFSVEELKRAASHTVKRQASGEQIFRRVMREIASSKKEKRL